MTAPALVTLHLWGVPRAKVAAAFGSMAYDRVWLRRSPGMLFGKLLGTGDGRTFTMRDADPRHWGVLATWSSDAAALAFETSPLVRRWNERSEERLRITLIPLASKGQWAGREPFGDPDPVRYSGPVAAITRARLRPQLAWRFWRAVPPVSKALTDSPGLRLAVGIGEAPVGLQGTFSLWAASEQLMDFAYRNPEHIDAIRQTEEVGWYAEELFARFAVRSVQGRFAGADWDEVHQ